MTVSLISFAFIFGLLISKVGLPPMVGFLIAGFVYNIAGLEAPSGLETIANLGVTLLLFTIGLKLKIKDLAAKEIWGSSVLHIVGSTLFFWLILTVSKFITGADLFKISALATWVLAFGLSFSSTVFAVKVLEDKGDMNAFYGTVGIGILVMQDVFAVIFLTVSEGKYPSLYALLVLVLLIPVVRRWIYKLIDNSGHGELLVLSSLFFALGAGYEFFYAVDLKGDLGALLLGVVISNHPKSKAMAKSLLNLKELMLVGFFLSIGMSGLPTLQAFCVAIFLVMLLPLKTLLYFVILTRFNLRSRTSMFGSLALGNYSEFGLIVAGLGVTQGYLPVDWLLIVAIAVSISFAAVSPFNQRNEEFYQRYKSLWDRFQSFDLHPKDGILDTGENTVLIVGMGRVGAGAYNALNEVRKNHVLGIEINEDRAETLRAEGYNVEVADATDTDFWNMVRLSEPIEEIILLAMPNHDSNLLAAERIKASGLDCKIVAIAKHESEVAELRELGIPSFNLYREAGQGLGLEAISIIS